MNEAATIAAHIACEALINTYNNQIDTGRASENFGLFSDGGVMVLAGRELSGESLKRALNARQSQVDRKTCHVAANFQMLSCDEAQAASYCVILFFLLEKDAPSPKGPTAILTSHDEFVKGADGRWRFARRVGSIVAGIPG